MELHWQSRVLSKSPVLKKFQLSTPNTDGVWAVDISCVHPTLTVVSSFMSKQFVFLALLVKEPCFYHAKPLNF